jgi:hypothetical protein
MDEVPLIEKVQKNDINTTIIAIKKQLKELNALLGLIDIQSDKQDLSPYVRKDEVIDEVKRFDLSPVTSNAVSKAISYSTSEIKTGAYWYNGKPIYRKCFSGTGFTSSAVSLGISNIGEIISLDSMARVNMAYLSGYMPLAGAVRTGNSGSCNPAYLFISTDKTTYEIMKTGTQTQVDLYEWHFTIEYTKTTD